MLNWIELNLIKMSATWLFTHSTFSLWPLFLDLSTSTKCRYLHTNCGLFCLHLLDQCVRFVFFSLRERIFTRRTRTALMFLSTISEYRSMCLEAWTWADKYIISAVYKGGKILNMTVNWQMLTTLNCPKGCVHSPHHIMYLPFTVSAVIFLS